MGIETWSAHKKEWKRTLLALVGGFLPLILWFAFSLIYYGFFFPNTSYGKLATGVPQGLLFAQGLNYYFNLLYTNTLTFLIILAGLVIAFISRSRYLVSSAVGLSLYLGYILYIGGDFMSGRFFTVPFLVALVLLLQSGRIKDLRTLVIPLAIVAAFGLATPYSSTFSGIEYGNHRYINDIYKISDERAVYYTNTGLLIVFPEGDISGFEWAADGVAVRDSGEALAVPDSAGFFCYFAGPEVWCVDELGLVDPLLSRLPAEYEIFWRIGHNLRTMPEGYRETLIENQNFIADPDISEYYDHLSLVTRGPVFNPLRLKTIWKMNTGQYEYLLP
jgi:arabinofuranosyltransferase